MMLPLFTAIALAIPAPVAVVPTVGVSAEAARVPSHLTSFARCVVHRESHGNRRAVNRGSGAMGLFQFMPPWQGSLQYVVSRRLKAHGMGAHERAVIRERLEHLPINRWPARMQWVGFLQVVAEGGSHHWALRGSACEAMRP